MAPEDAHRHPKPKNEGLTGAKLSIPPPMPKSYLQGSKKLRSGLLYAGSLLLDSSGRRKEGKILFMGLGSVGTKTSKEALRTLHVSFRAPCKEDFGQELEFGS